MEEEFFKHDEYQKSPREQKIDQLCENVRNAPPEEKARAEKALLDFVEAAPEPVLKIILFNGPPRSGKDTATRLVLELLGERGYFYRFASPLKDAVHALFGMSKIQQEHFDSIKDKPSSTFFGMTPREAYIWMSELVVKPKFGSDFFANVAVNSIRSIRAQSTDDRIIVVSDCGFNEEATALVKEFGEENVTVVHLEREGCTFNNDSRSYIDAGCKVFNISNNGTVDELRGKVKSLIAKIYAK